VARTIAWLLVSLEPSTAGGITLWASPVPMSLWLSGNLFIYLFGREQGEECFLQMFLFEFTDQ
jgi:hypothetical protein